MSVTLRVHELSKTYGSGDQAVQAVKNASFSTEPGEFVAVVGPSGSGKTTLLAMIGGLLDPTSGRIEVNGRDIAQLSRGQQAAYRRESVGYVFQANNLLPYLTARENLLVMSRITGGRGRSANARADQLLEELGLTKRARALATELSGGERQRVAIGRALMNDPELVLVDEPTASLDSARGRQVVESLIQEVKSRGKLGLMVTHDLAMAELADRIIEMHDGALSVRSREVKMG
jgi:putative ABC transport system ATP-binding protein